MVYTPLNVDAWVNISEVADWLKIPLEVIGEEGDTKSLATLQDIDYTSKLQGTEGDGATITYVAGGTAGAEVVTVDGKNIEVEIESGVSTANQIKDAIDNDDEASTLVSSFVNANNPQVPGQATFAGGAFASKFNARSRRVLKKVINGACSKVQDIVQTSIKLKEFVEYHDGSNSNVIKPHHWPIRSITELRIDYNRNFTDETIIEAQQYFLRGGADLAQQPGDVSLQIVGNDVVLRDDNETFIIGRIFSGSVLGSIKITYKAGWETLSGQIPEDIEIATYQLIEYWWLQRENRDINLTSKGLKGETYSKMKDGIPEQIYETLEQYEDVSFGTTEMPQRNYFSV